MDVFDDVAQDDRFKRIRRRGERLQGAGMDAQAFLARVCDGDRVEVHAFDRPAEILHELENLAVATTDVEHSAAR